MCEVRKTDKYKLLGIMAEKNVTQKQLAKMIYISVNSMCNKLNGRGTFTVDEAAKICVALDLKDEKVMTDVFLR